MRNKTIDKRIQKRRIIIEFEKIGSDYCINQYIDNMVIDIKNIISQREFDNNTNVQIILE